MIPKNYVISEILKSFCLRFFLYSMVDTSKDGEECPVMMNLDYVGAILSTSYSLTWKNCSKTCKDKEKCKFWTFASKDIPDPWGEKCYLRETYTEKKNGVPSVVSGMKSCQVSPSLKQMSCPVLIDVDLTGTVLSTSHAVTWEDCPKLCNKIKKCKYWTYASKNISKPWGEKCYFREVYTEKKIGVKNVVSGEKLCTGGTITPIELQPTNGAIVESKENVSNTPGLKTTVKPLTSFSMSISSYSLTITNKSKNIDTGLEKVHTSAYLITDDARKSGHVGVNRLRNSSHEVTNIHRGEAQNRSGNKQKPSKAKSSKNIPFVSDAVLGVLSVFAFACIMFWCTKRKKKMTKVVPISEPIFGYSISKEKPQSS